MSNISLAELIDSPYDCFSIIWDVHELDKTIEINDWHKNQSVLDHTFKVFESIEAVLSLRLIGLAPTLVKTTVDRFVEEVVGNQTRRDLLLVSALLHDVGKPATIKADQDGITSCPNHSQVGADMLRDRILISDLGPDSLEYVLKITEFHHTPDSFIDLSGREGFLESRDRFRSEYGTFAIDLLLFYIADFEGCDLVPAIERTKPAVYSMVAEEIDILLKS